MLAAKLNNTHSAGIGFFWLKSVKAWMIACACRVSEEVSHEPSGAGFCNLFLFSLERLTMPEF